MEILKSGKIKKIPTSFNFSISQSFNSFSSFNSIPMKTYSPKSFSFLKYSTLFVLGISAVYFASAYTSINTTLTNATQYIQKILLTSNGNQDGTTGIILDGTTGGGVTISNLISAIALGTDSNGKIIASTSGNLYGFIS
ncbi:TPA: hypothetical protein DCZ39_07810 [Patescibacteria group bacterium]|nr:hypothetical protein [Candidatus Gracilibacteria bacterium]